MKENSSTEGINDQNLMIIKKSFEDTQPCVLEIMRIKSIKYLQSGNVIAKIHERYKNAKI